MDQNNYTDSSGNSLKLIRQLPEHSFVMRVVSVDGAVCEFTPSTEQLRMLGERFSAVADFASRVKSNPKRP